MVRWLLPILLLGVTIAAAPGRMPVRCDDAMLRVMGCGEKPIEPAPEAASCCAAERSGDVAPDIAAAPRCDRPSASVRPGSAGACDAAGADHACPLCAVVCGALCERASPWGLLGLGLGGTTMDAAPVAALLPESAWLAREASERFPLETAAPDGRLTFDRPRRQAKLCVWTV